MAGFFDFLTPVAEFISGGSGYIESATKYAGLIGAAAGAAGAVLPFLTERNQMELPRYEAPTAQEYQSQAAAEAQKRRRELARRRGQASTVRTSLGVRQDIAVRRTGFLGV